MVKENKIRKWKGEEIELLEEYNIDGTRRYRFHVKESNIIIDIRSSSEESAWNKVFKMLDRMRFKNPNR